VRHPFFSASRPLVFAHRGGAALAPENTVAAFENAVALGVDGLELDVRLSRDGVVVVHHDETLERTTRLRGRVVDRTAEALAASGVPDLADVLRRFSRTRIIIEMKVNTQACARAVLDVVRASGAGPRVCLGSFGLRALRGVRRLDPTVATSAGRLEVRWAVYRSWCRLPFDRVRYSGYQVPECAGATRIVSPRFIGYAHRAGLGVQVWTVNREDDARRLIAWGVDALITDRPDLIVPLVGGAP
jgi:glycerophosphoryl diester phosphodiesterase